MKAEIKSQRVRNIIDELKDQYLEEDRCVRPWIIGFSGGKDSTVLLTLTWLALTELKDEGIKLKRNIYVVCNDTMVENPVIEEYVVKVLDKIKRAAKEQQLPISVATTTPELEDSFWCCVIGKGYPVPNNSFRFCTEKMKIKPTSKFITDQVAADGEAIVLVGTRLSESQQRERSIKRHEIKGHRLSKHPLNPNTFTYAPIKELMLEEVWWIINTIPSPWGFDNQILFQIYLDASADDYECPTVVTDDSHRSCGQSRFGCWICTVVKEDKSIITAKPKAHAFKNEMCFPLTKTKCELKKHPNSKFECFFNDFNRTKTSLFLPFPSKLIQDNLVCVLELQE